jgi:dihydropteroate synthase
LAPKKTLNIQGKLIDLSSPKVMGILNITPDSFFEKSRMENEKIALQSAETMLAEGATFLDVGGYSSRPGAADISEQEEIDRIKPVISSITRAFPEAIMSIDTFRSGVAKAAIDNGAKIVNDISAGYLDENMLDTVADLKVPFIGMHMKGNPKTMNEQTAYNDLLGDMMTYFAELKQKCLEKGILDLIIDPGFGFAKTIEQNYYLLNHVSFFKQLDCPILVGLSRKSMIYKFLETSPEQSLNGTAVLNTVALIRGCDILRVHDVKEAVEAIMLVNELNGACS